MKKVVLSSIVCITLAATVAVLARNVFLNPRNLTWIDSIENKTAFVLNALNSRIPKDAYNNNFDVGPFSTKTLRDFPVEWRTGGHTVTITAYTTELRGRPVRPGGYRSAAPTALPPMQARAANTQGRQVWDSFTIQEDNQRILVNDQDALPRLLPDNIKIMITPIGQTIPGSKAVITGRMNRLQLGIIPVN